MLLQPYAKKKLYRKEQMLKISKIQSLDGSVQHLNHAIVCRFHHWTFFLSLYEQKRQLNQCWYLLGSMNTLKEICQRMTSSLKACFPVLWYRGLKSHSSECSSCLRSTCVQVGWWILQRKNKSSTSLGSCKRTVYYKVLHCGLRGILMSLLTHV